METTHQIIADPSYGVAEAPRLLQRSQLLDRAFSMAREQYHNRLTAKYDAAQTTRENEIHWASSDSMSAAASLSPDVRKKLRERSRYEESNSAFYSGALDANADAMIGSGPSLRFFFGDDNQDTRTRNAFRRWSRKVQLAYKLRMIDRALMRDGEVLVVPFNNYRVGGMFDDEVALDLRIVECDHVAEPYGAPNDPYNHDGVIVDASGVIDRLHALRRHPGDSGPWLSVNPLDMIEYDASEVIWLYHSRRPGAVRGIPAVTPCLQLFAQFRRYKLAVLTAAETAANVAAVLKLDATVVASQLANNPEGSVPLQEELFEITRGALPALPPGYSLDQLDPKQPTDTIEMFERVLMREVARSLGQTYSVIVGDSGGSNMSSANIDRRSWWEYLEPRRAWLDEVVLDPVVGWWWAQQRLIPREIPYEARAVDHPVRRTTWPTRWEHNDPLKVANAEAVRHQMGLLTDDRYLESNDIDPVEHAQELERQVKRRRQVGIAAVGAGDTQTQGGQDARDTTAVG